jgi:hypothetical protein
VGAEEAPDSEVETWVEVHSVVDPEAEIEPETDVVNGVLVDCPPAGAETPDEVRVTEGPDGLGVPVDVAPDPVDEGVPPLRGVLVGLGLREEDGEPEGVTVGTEELGWVLGV